MWFKVDDGIYDHPKFRKLGQGRLAAIGLWTLCGAWAGRNGTDGFIPRAVVRQMAGDLRTARKLVAVGLWTEDEHDDEQGFRFHDWADFQPTRAAREELRRSRAEAGRKGGIRSGQVRGSKPEASASAVAFDLVEANRTPEPEPDPLATDVASRRPRKRGEARGTRIPDEFAVTPEMVEWARANTPHVDGRSETARFVDYWRAKSGKDGTKRDWVATWRNWMRTAQERVEDRGTRNDRSAPEPSRAQQWLAMAEKDGPEVFDVEPRRGIR